MEDTRWLNQDEQRAWRGFLLASRLVLDELGRELGDSHELSLTDYGILVRLSEEPSRSMRMTDLAAASGLSKSRLSHQMNRLEARGLTERSVCPGDGRGTLALLTDAGFELLTDAAHVHVAGVRAHLFDFLDAEDIKRMAGWSERVVRHLDRDGRSGPLLPAAGL